MNATTKDTLKKKMADKQFDTSPEDMRRFQLKAEQRAVLKKEYWKQITNPHRHASNEGGTLFDAGVQRFMALKVTGYDHFRPTPRSAGYALGFVVIPIVAYTWLLKSSRDCQEEKYRTGQVAYKDRRFKFI
ncbi:hypothetical protein B566_EDAN007089 [Ephemera danica]|nr:hypothetical protein B566_EDAN007089 [Ephemera danica]